MEPILSNLYDLPSLVGFVTRLFTGAQGGALQAGEFSDLSLRQIFYLELVAKLGHPTLTEIARQARVSKPSASVAVERLAEAGYLEKVRSDADRRSLHLHLTVKGRRLDETHRHIHAHLAEALSAGLDPAETSQLVALLNKVVQTLESQNAPETLPD